MEMTKVPSPHPMYDNSNSNEKSKVKAHNIYNI